MKITSLILAVISLALSLALAAFLYDADNKIAKLDEALRQNFAQSLADNKQNAAAIDEMKTYMKHMVDLVK